MASLSYLTDATSTLKTKTHIYVSLLDINVQVDTEYDLGLQDMVDNAEECIVMMEAAGVRMMNVSFEVQNDDEDDVLCTPSTWVPGSSVHVMMSAMMSRLPSGKSSV
jgi:hypothetical protein